MANKCGACGKYLSSAECIKCTKCTSAFHRACVALATTGTVSAVWQCPGCKAKVPKSDNTSTPVKGVEQRLDSATAVTSAADTHAAAAAVPANTQVQGNLACEIRAFREELGAVRMELKEMRSELASFQSSIKASNDRILGVEGRLTKLEENFQNSVPSNTDALEDTINGLRQELNIRDQELLLNDVEIAGIPENADDNLVHVVKLLARKICIEIQDGDIVHVERVGSIQRNLRDPASTGASVESPRPRNIVVRLARRITRDQLISAARVRRVITSTDIELQGAPRRIYLNERLTRTNRQLFARAREAARRAHYKYVWTREGKIFARKEDGKMADRIRTEKDLPRIFGTSSV